MEVEKSYEVLSHFLTSETRIVGCGAEATRYDREVCQILGHVSIFEYVSRRVCTVWKSALMCIYFTRVHHLALQICADCKNIIPDCFFDTTRALSGSFLCPLAN